MRVSKKFPIAVHTLLMFAYFPEERITSETIAESAGCNAVIVRNIFKDLKQAKLLNPGTGKSTTQLAKSLYEITLWDIYCAVETVRTDEIFKMNKNASGTCRVGSNLNTILLNHLDDAVAALKKELSKVKLNDLAEELRNLKI